MPVLAEEDKQQGCSEPFKEGHINSINLAQARGRAVPRETEESHSDDGIAIARVLARVTG